MAGISPDEQSVFLNVPYDHGYERNFVAHLKKQHGQRDIFHRLIFHKLVAAATELASKAGFITP